MDLEEPSSRPDCESKHRSRTWPGWPAFLFVLSLASEITALFWSWYHPRQVYSDLVVGNITLADACKSKDFQAFAVFCTSALGIALLLAGVFRKLTSRANDVPSVALGVNVLLAVGSIPFALWAGFSFAAGAATTVPFESIISQGATLLILILSLWLFRKSPSDDLLNIGLRVQFLLFCAYFGGLGMETFLSRGLLLRAKAVEIGAPPIILLTLGAAAIVTAWAMLRGSHPRTAARRLEYSLLVFQALLPFLFFIVVPLRRLPDEPRPLLLLGVLCLVAAACWLCLARRWLRLNKSTAGPAFAGHSAFIAPICLAAVAVALLAAPDTNYLYIGKLDSFECFHWGEQLLPWHQLVNFGQLPYADFVPIHGLMPLIGGALNAVFFSGKMVDHLSAEVVWGAIAATIAVLLAARFWTLEAALVLVLASCVYDRLLLVAPAILLLCNSRILQNHFAWLLAWLITCPLMVLYNGAIGSAFTVATIPIAIYFASRLYRQDRSRFYKFLSICGMVLLIALAVTPFRRMGVGLARFLSENAKSNVVANGIPWSIQNPATGEINIKTYEILRLAWIAAAICSACIFLREVGRGRKDRRPDVFCAAFVITAFLVLASSWSINRIDQGGPSRLGVVSYTAVLTLLPLICRFHRNRAFKVVAAAFVIGVFNQFRGGDIGLSMARSATKNTLPRPRGADIELVQGEKIGAPKLDGMYANHEALSQLADLHTLLVKYLRPGETFWDLSYNQGLYYAFNYRVPAFYGATYPAASLPMQERILERLRSSPPPLILALPSPQFDGIKASLRTYLLYRYAIENYVPLQLNGVVALVRPDRLGPGEELAKPEQLRLLEQTFDQPSLDKLPAAWGGSWNHLSERFVETGSVIIDAGVSLHDLYLDSSGGMSPRADGDPEKAYLSRYPDVAEAVKKGDFPNGMAHYTTHGRAERRIYNSSGDPYFTMDVESLNLAAAGTDFVVLDLSIDGDPQAELEIALRWTTDLEPASQPHVVTLRSGKNLIPLGSYPGWALATRIKSLRANFNNLTAGQTVHWRDVKFLKLRR